MSKDEARQQNCLKGDPIFLWVGRLDANKDPVNVVKAFVQFLSYQPRASLYMIFHTEELIEEIKRIIAPCKQNIFLVGSMPHEQLQRWFSSADFFISGSHYEGGGIAVCEAMSCGCIPLLTNIASFRMMTAGGSFGKLYVPGDVEALLLVLRQTLEMDLEIEREKVLKQFQSALSFEAIADKINQVLVSS
jgi:glycosyltransferase involved in cell wall biosynthesis